MAQTFLLTALVVLATLSVTFIRRLNPQAPLAPVLAAHGLALSLCASVLAGGPQGAGLQGSSLQSDPFVQAWLETGRTERVSVRVSGPCAGVFSAPQAQGGLKGERPQGTLPSSCEAALIPALSGR